MPSGRRNSASLRNRGRCCAGVLHDAGAHEPDPEQEHAHQDHREIAWSAAFSAKSARAQSTVPHRCRLVEDLKLLELPMVFPLARPRARPSLRPRAPRVFFGFSAAASPPGLPRLPAAGWRPVAAAASAGCSAASPARPAGSGVKSWTMPNAVIVTTGTRRRRRRAAGFAVDWIVVLAGSQPVSKSSGPIRSSARADPWAVRQQPEHDRGDRRAEPPRIRKNENSGHRDRRAMRTRFSPRRKSARSPRRPGRRRRRKRGRRPGGTPGPPAPRNAIRMAAPLPYSTISSASAPLRS